MTRQITMEITADTKVVIGILLTTVLIIGGAAFFTSRKAPEGEIGQGETASQPERLIRNTEGHIRGPADASVTVVEFGDFQCPACGTLHPTMKALREQYTDQSVRFAYRHFPLPQHEHAHLAAQASEAAGEEGKFWEFHDLLFEHQQKLARDDLERYAQQIGLNMDVFTAALDEGRFKDVINQDVSDGRALRIDSTPTLFINSTKYNGPYSVEAIGQAIDEALRDNSS